MKYDLSFLVPQGGIILMLVPLLRRNVCSDGFWLSYAGFSNFIYFIEEGLMKIVDYIRVNSLDEAVDIIKKLGDKGVVMAGGTAFQFITGDDEKIAVVLDIPGLKGITKGKKSFKVGALAHISDLQEYSDKHWVLDKVAKRMASQQIRNMSTVGGNISRIFPWADFPVALLALNSKIRFYTAIGKEKVKMEKFVSEMQKLLKGKNYLTIGINVPFLNKNEGFGYFKEVRISAAFSTFTAAAVVRCKKDKIEKVRLAAGAALSLPIRLTDIEDSLAGCSADSSAVKKVISKYSGNYKWRGREDESKEFIAHLAEARLADVVLEAVKDAEGRQ